MSIAPSSASQHSAQVCCSCTPRARQEVATPSQHRQRRGRAVQVTTIWENMRAGIESLQKYLATSPEPLCPIPAKTSWPGSACERSARPSSISADHGALLTVRAAALHTTPSLASTVLWAESLDGLVADAVASSVGLMRAMVRSACLCALASPSHRLCLDHCTFGRSSAAQRPSLRRVIRPHACC